MPWNNPGRPPENGVVERSQGTSDRWCPRWTCATPEELQAWWGRRDRLRREVYADRGRLSRSDWFPGLKDSGGPYDRNSGVPLGEWSRVAEHRSTSVMVRRGDQSGLVSRYNPGHYVGKIYQGKEVYVMYDPNLNDWVFADREGRQLHRQHAEQPSRERVMDLEVAHRR